MKTPTGADVRLRSGPGVQYEITGQVQSGAKVTIECSVTDGSAVPRKKGGASRVWNRTSAGWLTDVYTMTGSWKPAAPICAAYDAARLRNGQQQQDLALMEEMRAKGGPAASEFEYHFHQPVGNLDPTSLGVTAESITTDIVTNFDDNFQFPGCGRLIRQDQECTLRVHGFNAPIHINQIWNTGFRFTSLPGHPEGPDRTITFQFQQDSKSHLMYLDVTATGPRGALTGSRVGRLESRVMVQKDWPDFAYNLGRRYGLTTLERYLHGVQGGN